MVYSHIWDVLLKVISLAGIIIAAASMDLEERIRTAGAGTHSEFVMIVLLLIIWAILYRQFLSILASWFYARVSLGANVTFSEAVALRKLFQIDFSFHWLPMRDIKKLPREQRHDALMLALDRFGPTRKAMFL